MLTSFKIKNNPPVVWKRLFWSYQQIESRIRLSQEDGSPKKVCEIVKYPPKYNLISFFLGVWNFWMELVDNVQPNPFRLGQIVSVPKFHRKMKDVQKGKEPNTRYLTKNVVFWVSNGSYHLVPFDQNFWSDDRVVNLFLIYGIRFLSGLFNKPEWEIYETLR